MTATPDLTAAPLAAGELLRRVFRRHAVGVAVITAAQDGKPFGFTATSLTSVSADPALISFGIADAASSWPAVSTAPYVGIHLLGVHQQELAQRFARSGADRFAAPTRWRLDEHAVPLIEDVPAHLVCRVVARIPAGDHHLVLAEPVSGDAAGPGRPLLYHQGRFGELRD